MMWPDVNSVVVNQAFFHGTGDIDAARAVILADVVAHYRARVTGAFCRLMPAFVANQEKTTVVVVAVIVLDEGIAAIPVGIKALPVALSFRSVGLVVLNHRIVGAPGPDGYVVSIRPLIGMPDNVAFDDGAVCRNHHDAIAADVMQVVSPKPHLKTRIPSRANPRIRPAENSAAVHAVNLVVLDA